MQSSPSSQTLTPWKRSGSTSPKPEPFSPPPNQVARPPTALSLCLWTQQKNRESEARALRKMLQEWKEEQLLEARRKMDLRRRPPTQTAAAMTTEGSTATVQSGATRTPQLSVPFGASTDGAALTASDASHAMTSSTSASANHSRCATTQKDDLAWPGLVEEGHGGRVPKKKTTKIPQQYPYQQPRTRRQRLIAKWRHEDEGAIPLSQNDEAGSHPCTPEPPHQTDREAVRFRPTSGKTCHPGTSPSASQKEDRK